VDVLGSDDAPVVGEAVTVTVGVVAASVSPGDEQPESTTAADAARAATVTRDETERFMPPPKHRR
jgi:hypothetical protein